MTDRIHFMHKVCSTCKVEKGPEAFNKRRTVAGNVVLAGECRECHKATAKASWARHAAQRRPLARQTPIRKVNPVRKAKRAAEYRRHLASKYWKILRCLIWQRCGGTCERCRHPIPYMSKMHGAHKTYARFGHEHLTDVEATCAPCNIGERLQQTYKGRMVA